MDQATASIIGRRFDYCFEGAGSYPAILDKKVDLEAGQAVRIEGPGGPVDILTLAQDHGGVPSIGFRIGTFAYCNDVVRLPEATLERLTGLDTFVVDALRYKAHPTHASVAEALSWIERLKPRRSILTNLHVDLDYATLRAELPAGVEPAFDGLEREPDRGHHERRDRLDRDRNPEVCRAPDDVDDPEIAPQGERARDPASWRNLA